MSNSLRAPYGKLRTVTGWLDLRTGPPDVEGDFPTLESTGPRYAAETVLPGGYTTVENGEVLERIEFNGRLRIQHDNVTVRDCTVMGTSTYMIHIVTHATAGRDPTGIVIEYTAIDGTNAGDNTLAFYGDAGGFILDHVSMYNINRAAYVKRNCRIQNCYINNTRTYAGAHREAIQHHGGVGNIEIVHNTLFCSEGGTSAAVALYGDNGVVQNILVENNLMASRSYYILYGGSLSGDPYPDGVNNRVINNHFSSSILAPNGTIPTPINGLEAGQRGNEEYGNIWHETGEPI